MSTKFNTNKNTSPSRTNANKSPRKTGYQPRLIQSFPRDYGIKSSRFGTVDFVPGPATLYARKNSKNN